MSTHSPSLESRLRLAAALLLCLPAIVAAACFAHGHGALSSTALLGALSACIAAGATTGLALLRPLKSSSSSIAAGRNAAAAHS
jgi:hypothetical protein